MPTTTDEKQYEVSDLSGAIQRKTTKFSPDKQANQVNLAINASFGRIGGVEKIKGYEQLGAAVTTTSTSSSTSTSTSTSSSTSSSTSTSSTTTEGA